MSDILVPAAPVYQLLESKRSKFHCHLIRADKAEQAQRLVAQLRLQYPQANHVCSAYIAGVPGRTTALGCSDDGEPSGTAGRPMLQVLQHGGVACVAAAVAREFGGTKLGTGGLARAYGGAVVAAMAQLSTERQRQLCDAQFALPYAYEAQARHLLQQHDGELLSVHYDQRVCLQLRIEQALLPAFSQALRDACGGQSEQLNAE